MAHTYDIIIDRGMGAPGHIIEVFGGLNTTENVLYQCSWVTVQVTSSEGYGMQMLMNTATQKRHKSGKRISKTPLLPIT